MFAPYRIDNRICYLQGSSSGLPDDESWLSPEEADVLDGLSIPKRRQDWLLGRWTAKTALSLLAQPQQHPLKSWKIMAEEDGAPGAWLNGKPVDLCISLSHSNGLSFFTAAQSSRRMGCDIEKIEARSRAFEETFFTRSERGMLEEYPADERDLLVTFIWSAKESVLKALRTGLRSDTRRIRIVSIDKPGSNPWQTFKARDSQSGDGFSGWWRVSEGMVLTITSDHVALELVDLTPFTLSANHDV